MSKPVFTVAEAQSMRDAARVMVHRKVSSAVVVRGGRVVGIVTENDVLRLVAKAGQAGDVPVRRAMTSPVVVASADNDLHEAIKLMVQSNIKHLPILKGDKLVGIVTLTDFVRVEPAVHEMLEQALSQVSKEAARRFEKYLARREPPSVMYG